MRNRQALVDMNYIDKKIEKLLARNTWFSILYLLFLTGTLVYFISGFPSLTLVTDRIVMFLLILMLCFYVFILITHFIDSPKVVYKFNLSEDEYLEIKNGLCFIQRYKYDELYSLSKGSAPRWAFRPDWFPKNSEWILRLKNGGYYRISPFMENREELISKLQSIIANNHIALDNQ